ncbi:MAG: hypothetical protein ACEPOZ_05670 [Marinifilaceae bacterium]
MEINLLYAILATFFLNLPFGYIRQGFKRYSFNWFFAIHVPIPVVIFFRYFFELGFQLYTYPFMLGAFFLGQFAGKKLRIYQAGKRQTEKVMSKESQAG